MGLLGRKKRKASAPDDEWSDADELVGEASDDEPDDESDESPHGVDVAADSGETSRRRPLDESEAGEGEAMQRLDLGSLRVPVLSDMEVRVELNERQQPVAASLLHAGSSVQVLAFAAPRGSGIWDEVRDEIADSVRKDGGEADEVDGVFGKELRIKLRAEVKPGQMAEQRLRFVGFDGPRWFVRGVFSGPAATNPQQAKALETVLTHVVVVRGADPMAPRDALPLRLPTDMPGLPQSGDAAQPPSLDPFERGPEITETR